MEKRFELYFRINEQIKWVKFSIYFLGHKIDFYRSKKTKNCQRFLMFMLKMTENRIKIKKTWGQTRNNNVMHTD